MEKFYKINNIFSNKKFLIILLIIILIILFYILFQKYSENLKKNGKEKFNNNLDIKDIPIYVINLEHRIDRKNKIEDGFKKAGINNYIITKAVNGKDLDIEQLKKDGIATDKIYKRGWYGCALSHLNIWKMCKIRPEQYFMVLEDDVVIPRDFVEKCNKILREIPSEHLDFDLLYLSINNGTKIGKYITPNIYIPENYDMMAGMQCYIFNKKCIDILISKSFPLYHAIDRILMDLSKSVLKTFVVKDNVINVNDYGDSETEKIV